MICVKEVSRNEGVNQSKPQVSYRSLPFVLYCFWMFPFSKLVHILQISGNCVKYLVNGYKSTGPYKCSIQGSTIQGAQGNMPPDFAVGPLFLTTYFHHNTF